MKKKRLGRGLSALLDPEGQQEANARQDMAKEHAAFQVSVENIELGRNQPRKSMDPAALEQLSASIREKGILQPLIVRRHPENPKRYELIAGERRLRASKHANLERVPVILWEAGDEEALELALVENVQREDLNPLEEADAYALLQERFSLTQEEVASRVGKQRSTVANILRLRELKQEERKALLAGELTAGHARALLSMKNPTARQRLLHKILAEGLNVRQAERYAQADFNKPKAKGKSSESKPLSAEMSRVEDVLRDVLGTKVKIQPNLGILLEI